MANPPGLDNLLNDLLTEAKKGVAAEQKKVDDVAEQRLQAERDAKAREEGRKREEAQARVIEENRRRNEALARRDRGDGERKGASTVRHANHTQPVPEPAKVDVVPAAKAKPTNKLILAGLVAGGLAVGVGTGFALQPEMKGTFPDVAMAASAVVQAASKSASVEKKLNGELADVKQKLGDLEKKVGVSGSDVAKLRTDLDKFRGDLAKAKKDLEDARAAAGVKKVGVGGPADDGMPKLDTGAYGEGDKKKKTP